MSKIKQLVLLLDLKWDDDKMESEHFYINDQNNLIYKISESGLFFVQANDSRSWSSSNVNLFGLLNGEIKISKLPYKPTFRDKYFISNITMPELFSCTYWFNDKINQYHLDNNLIVKTREEAVQCSKSILKFLETEAQK